MSNLDRLEALKIKHRELDKKCQEGFSNYLDDASLNKMKIDRVKKHHDVPGDFFNGPI